MRGMNVISEFFPHSLTSLGDYLYIKDWISTQSLAVWQKNSLQEKKTYHTFSVSSKGIYVYLKMNVIKS